MVQFRGRSEGLDPLDYQIEQTLVRNYHAVENLEIDPAGRAWLHCPAAVDTGRMPRIKERGMVCDLKER